MLYSVYKITNIINGKIYIGKHQTTNLDDGYMGSGKLLKRAQKKYGLQNFIKEILFVFDNEDQMNKKEKELVNENFVNCETTYNLWLGGKGGSNNSNNGMLGKLQTEKQRNAVRNFNLNNRHIYTSEEYRKKMSESKKGNKSFSGKTHTEETKAKMRETKKKTGSQKGEKNSQFGRPRSEETKRKIRETLLRKRLDR